MTDSHASDSPTTNPSDAAAAPVTSPATSPADSAASDEALWAAIEAKRHELEAHLAYIEQCQYGGPDGVPQMDADQREADDLRLELSWMRQSYYATEGGKRRLQQQTDKTRCSTAMLVSRLRAKWALQHSQPRAEHGVCSLSATRDGVDPWAEYISAGTEQLFEKVIASFPPGSEAVFGMRTHLADSLISAIVVPLNLPPSQQVIWEHHAKPCRQVVMLGSGLDTSAGKHPTRRFFEVDLPEMIALKQKVIRELPAHVTKDFPYSERHVSYIPYTFGKDEQPPLLELLTEQGFDPEQPTLWLMMGVSYYLTREQFCQTLSMISQFPGVHVFAFDYALPSPADDAHQELARLGEPIRFQCADIAPLLIEHFFPYIHEESFCAYYRRTYGLDATVLPNDKRALRFVVCSNNRNLMRSRTALPKASLSFGDSYIG